MKDPKGRLARWSVQFQQYDFTLEHRKGRLNVGADALSRAVPEVASFDVKLIGEWRVKPFINMLRISGRFKVTNRTGGSWSFVSYGVGS